jgi:ElaB/YqjD/DUF883 family membrane-anchored ribosome-binding protein
VARHRHLTARWTESFARWDASLASALTGMEDEERDLLRRLSRLAEAQTAAARTEIALDRLRVALHEATDWVRDRGDPRGPAAVVRLEVFEHADPWMFEAQVSLARARWALSGTDSIDAGSFQAELLSEFARHWATSLGHDISSREGTARSTRSVSWTLTTVRALRGYLSRSATDAEQALAEVRDRRTTALSKSRV